MCHHNETDGLSVICHNPSFEYVKDILDKKNTENSTHRKVRIHESEYKEQCIAYFERYFEALAKEAPLILPLKIPHEFRSITVIMSEWCIETNPYSNIKGFVIHSFSTLKHLFRHGFTKKLLRDCLQIENFSEAPLIVVYNPAQKAFLLLRKAESKKLTTDIALSINDTKLFILLFHDVLANSGMKLVPFVITDEKVKPDNSDCQLCLNHVLSLKELEETDKFDFFWERIGGSYCKGEIDEFLSKTLSAKFVSIVSAALLYPNYIPIFNKKQNLHQHMVSVHLTPQQLNIYYSQDKHMIVKGGFGCGKSIIAAAMLQKISEGLEEDEKLIHVCYNPTSELLGQMLKNNQVNSIDNVVTINNKDGFKLSAIIEHVTKQEGSGKVNFVVDEYNGEDLDESEAGELNRVFSELLKESFILLIPQPTKIMRVVNNISEKKYQFHKLETMKTYELTLNMRNSIENYQLVEATKRVLNEENTIFLHQKNSKRSDQLINIKESAGKNFNSNKSVSKQEDLQQPALESKHGFKGQPEENSSSFKMGLDEAQAVIGSPVVDVSGGSSPESKFGYALVVRIGHRISASKPVLFELGDTNEFYKYLSLAVIFKKVLASSSKLVVLHFHAETDVIPDALCFVFEHLKIQERITTKYKEFESSAECILVCSFAAFRGLEYPRIFVLIDRDMYFLQHYLVETFDRCAVELFIVVLKNSPIMARLTTKWKTQELIRQRGLNIYYKVNQRREFEFNIDENQNTINVTLKFGYYKELEEAFKQLRNSKDETISPIIEGVAKEIIDQNR